MRSSVRTRTVVGATAVVGLALTIGAVSLVVLLRRTLTDDVETAAALRADDVVALLRDGREPPDVLAAEGDDESLVQVLDRDGRVIAASANAEGAGPIADVAPGGAVTVSEAAGEDDPFRVVARAGPDGTLVLSARSLDLVDESVATVTAILLVGVPVLAALAAGTTWAVVGRALRPVEAIRREVASISASELERRVPEPASDDEIGRLARTMNAMLARLERARDRQRRFVSDASHELRSPLATSRHVLETSDHAASADLLAENLRMSALVDDLLLLARLDEADADPRATGPVDLDDLVLAEAAALRRRGVTVDTTGVGAGRVAGDAGQLGRLVRNLADNAARHASSAVELGVTSADGTVRVTVADDGPGIPPAAQERVFERFTRLDDARARDGGGAGLGLAIVAEVARAHGGSVRIDDRPGGGTLVVVDLPARQ
jgi:signal transduction histidine kinase